LKPACIKGKEFFTMLDGTLTLTSSGTGGKGISGDSTAVFSGGTVTVNVTGTNFGSSGGSQPPRPGQQQSSNGVSAKGIKFDGNIVFSGSNVSVSCSSHEAIEAKGTLTISGGIVYGTSSSDDAINAASDFTITGGLVGAYATGNDALDANGNMYIRGGVVYAVSTAGTPEVSLDANTEGGKKLYIEGGTLIVIGGLESGAQLTQSCYKVSSLSNNTWYSITVGSDTYAFKTPASSSSGGGGGPRPGSGSSSLVVSGSVQPTVKSGVAVNGGTNYFNNTFTVGGTVSGGSQVSLTNYTGGGGFFK
ncbi:MAG: carbohydrate-binding domain-containing protein, partial [Bacteroidales bacterium]|nr:carbohydrate-binding domain-containing protein [Bacteroidales bacterium]